MFDHRSLGSQTTLHAEHFVVITDLKGHVDPIGKY